MSDSAPYKAMVKDSGVPGKAQLNFNGPEFVSAKFWEVPKKSSGS